MSDREKLQKLVNLVLNRQDRQRLGDMYSAGSNGAKQGVPLEVTRNGARLDVRQGEFGQGNISVMLN